MDSVFGMDIMRGMLWHSRHAFINNAESVFRASRISPSGLGLCTHQQMQAQGLVAVFYSAPL